MKTNVIFTLLTLSSLLTVASCSSSQQFQTKQEYKLDRVVYDIDDDQIRDVLKARKTETAFKRGQSLDIKTFEKERKRIERVVKQEVDPAFDKKYITFQIDTTLADQRYSIETTVRRNKQ
uniref:Lipoprotein n=1 Tax=Roseihalotalea indica TaxID=2867963 RepID=A0AA49GQ53_9BACT|nr:hypothetical protein K4G66_09320 [Tunicatimonas sp. TK19036]